MLNKVLKIRWVGLKPEGMEEFTGRQPQMAPEEADFTYGSLWWLST
jgi:hypothetical protein